jgi:hypothetical protein
VAKASLNQKVALSRSLKNGVGWGLCDVCDYVREQYHRQKEEQSKIPEAEIPPEWSRKTKASEAGAQ